VTPSARTLISTLPRGHEFEPADCTVTPAAVTAYLRATGDANDYADAVPALAAVALGLASLQAQVALPEGSLHTSQEVEHERTVRAGERLTLTGRIAQRSERQGLVISVIELELSGTEGVGIRSRTTIMAPGAGS